MTPRVGTAHRTSLDPWAVPTLRITALAHGD